MGATFERHDVNGQPGVIFRGLHGGVMSVMSFEVAHGRVATIRSVVNPDKLGPVGPVESRRDVMDGMRGESPMQVTIRPAAAPARLHGSGLDPGE